jgi:spermidine synthase
MSEGELIEARDSRYQHVEVRHRPDLEARVLSLDEGHDSFHSMLPDRGYLTGAYYDSFNVIAAQAVEGGRLRVLILGLAAGTHARQLLHFLGDRCAVEIVGVELDPTVVKLARAYLGLPEDPRLEVISGMDGRVYLAASDAEFDLLIVDCYSHQSYLPFHLASLEFFESARQRLRPGGILAMNLSGYGAVDPVVAAVTNTLAAAFRTPVTSVALSGTINLLVYAVRGEAAPLPPELTRDLLGEELREVLAGMCVPGRSFRTGVRPRVPVLRDDSGLLERMQETRLARRAEMLLDPAR